MDLYAPHLSRTGMTPLLLQYLDLHAQCPEALLLFRLGDFYELFFEDAQQTSRLLGLTLTRRGQHDGIDVPMCGIPFHALDAYAGRLLVAGFRLAICEQIGEPKPNQKGPMPRAIVRMLTPGTVVEEALSDARHPQLLAALGIEGTQAALAWADLSAGRCGVDTLTLDQVEDRLAQLQPAELLLADPAPPMWTALGRRHRANRMPSVLFDPQEGRRRCRSTWGIAVSLSGIEAGALGALLGYAQRAQGQNVMPLRSPESIDRHILQVDAATWGGLDVFPNPSKPGLSLFETIDRTISAGGSRLLHHRLTHAPTQLETIHHEHNKIQALLDHPERIDQVRQALQSLADLERSLTRLRLGRGGPRDLMVIPRSVQCSQELIGNTAESLVQLSRRLGTFLVDRPPLMARDGGFVLPGADPACDRWRQAAEGTDARIQPIHQSACADHKVAFKVRRHNALGTLLEAPLRDAERLRAAVAAGTLIHRQSLAGHVRYTTPELVAIDTEFGMARQRLLVEEYGIFDQLRTNVLDQEEGLRKLAQDLSSIDVAASIAFLMQDGGWILPELTNDRAFTIREGRHPMVAQAQGLAFTPNDCNLAACPAWILTGPNMAGKSTFLRQNALILLLAQAGMAVPAAHATIGLADRLLARIGASDALAEGRSTFLVEMLETASILTTATERSFVVLDEVGRGTDPQEGAAIAQACIEDLAARGCRTLFATHHRQIATPAPIGTCTKHMTVWMDNDEPRFLHQLQDGVADSSLGLLIARQAGIPTHVLDRARILAHTNAPAQEQTDWATILQGLDLDGLSARQALAWLHQAQRHARDAANARPGLVDAQTEG